MNIARTGSMPHTNTVLVVEDDPITRERIEAAVLSSDKLLLAGSVGTLTEALQFVAEHQPRVVLTDLGLPDGSGLDVIREVYRAAYGGESLVITVFGDERHVVAALKAGARGYLLKDSPYETIANDVLMLIAGGSPINPKVARYLLRQFNHWGEEERHKKRTMDELSLREREILALIAKGYRRGEIAELLSISLNTVGTHIKRIYEKLSIHSNVEAVQEAVNLGLVSAS